MRLYTILTWILLVLCLACTAQSSHSSSEDSHPKTIIPGAYFFGDYVPDLKGKRVACVVNQTSELNGTHLVDTLIELGVDIVSIMAPEHGFRGEADAGEKIEDGRDPSTGIPLISLYGKNKKPSSEQLSNVDILIFDIQDVGVRFYTYISTLAYVMEACAENNVPIIVLDRPNPNGHYVDGPILQKELSSFVGLHQIPIVYGMTIGEYASMVQGEKWINAAEKCDMQVVKCRNYDHNMLYELPVKPSPNLPNLRSILLYPSLCLFEGTTVSIGRGTDKQFQIIGHPDFKNKAESYSFIPEPKPGAKHPKLEGQTCYGFDLSTQKVDDLFAEEQLNLDYLIEFYNSIGGEGDFFISFFDKLAGNDILKEQIQNGLSPAVIRDSWQSDLDDFKAKRKKYLLYPDFE